LNTLGPVASNPEPGAKEASAERLNVLMPALPISESYQIFRFALFEMGRLDIYPENPNGCANMDQPHVSSRPALIGEAPDYGNSAVVLNTW
jgi:hypothetical protein